MTRKDYIRLAAELRTAYHDATNGRDSDVYGHRDTVVWVANRLACALSADNPRFNREHFLGVVRGEKDLQSRPSRNRVRS